MTRADRCRIGKHNWQPWVRTDGTKSGWWWCFRCHATSEVKP